MSTHLVPCPRGGACGKGARHDDRRGQIEVCRREAASSTTTIGAPTPSAAPPSPTPVAPTPSLTTIEVNEHAVWNATLDRDGVLVLEGDGVVRGGSPDDFEEGLADGTSVLLARGLEIRRAVSAAEDRLEYAASSGAAPSASPEDYVSPKEEAELDRLAACAGAAHATGERLARVDVTPGPVLARSLPAPEVLAKRFRIRHEVASGLLEIDTAAGSVTRALRALEERYEGHDVEDDVVDAWDALRARSELLSTARARVAANERGDVYTGSRY